MIKLARFVSDSSLEGLSAEVLEQLRPIAEEIVSTGAGILREEIDELLSRRGPPVAGGPPAEVMGVLRRSVVWTKPKWVGKHRVQADVGIPGDSDGGEYAARLEFGGRDEKGVYLPPHPFIRTAGQRTRRRMDTMLDEAE